MQRKQVGTPIAESIRGFAHKQPVFVVVSGRSKDAKVLFASIGKAPVERHARMLRALTVGRTYPTACVKSGYVSGPSEITLL